MKAQELIEKKRKKKKITPTYVYSGWGWYGYSEDSGTSEISENQSTNPTVDDISDVAKWFHTTADNLILELVNEPIAKFINQIQSMLSTYDKFSKDKKRTQKIMNEINKTNQIYPIYVEKNDDTNFIMEGRHRIVAFMLLGYKEVPVIYVSKKT